MRFCIMDWQSTEITHVPKHSHFVTALWARNKARCWSYV